MIVLPVNLGLLLIFSLIGVFAGGIHAAQRLNPRPLLRDILVQAAGGGLTSFLAGAVCLYWWADKNPYLSFVIAGIAGWLGTVLIDKAGAVAVRQADLKFNPPKDPS